MPYTEDADGSFQVKFDQFVEQGKVLHNYASILELLLRLRQCCDHPFLVMRCGFYALALYLSREIHIAGFNFHGYLICCSTLYKISNKIP